MMQECFQESAGSSFRQQTPLSKPKGFISVLREEGRRSESGKQQWKPLIMRSTLSASHQRGSDGFRAQVSLWNGAQLGQDLVRRNTSLRRCKACCCCWVERSSQKILINNTIPVQCRLLCQAWSYPSILKKEYDISVRGQLKQRCLTTADLKPWWCRISILRGKSGSCVVI